MYPHLDVIALNFLSLRLSLNLTYEALLSYVHSYMFSLYYVRNVTQLLNHSKHEGQHVTLEEFVDRKCVGVI